MRADRSGTRQGALALAALVLCVAACSGPLLARPAVPRPDQPVPSALPPRPADPVPVMLPADDGPHDRLTEWWYYTGHLVDAAGHPYGFEYVVFRAERGAFPVAWAAHLAVTDEAGDRFVYAQRSQVGSAVDVRADPTNEAGFAFALTGDPTATEAADRSPWRMEGGDGQDRLAARIDGSEAAMAGSLGPLAIDLAVRSTRPPVLHDIDGWVDFGPAGGSYYYSRTRMATSGTLTLDGVDRPVRGTTWFDHQWGDFIAIGGGWDWFAVGLDDGTDLTVSRVRDPAGREGLVYGTLIGADGIAQHLPGDGLDISDTATWTSARSGATYPAAWTISVPEENLTLDLVPTVADQELDTRATTGVIYWEGSATVRAMRDGRMVAGRAYVELTGYAGGAP